MCDHIMVDLETLSLTSNARIVSIGAMCFQSKGEGVGEPWFYQTIKYDEDDTRFDVDPGTLAWWKKQSPEAQKVLTDPDAPSLSEGLDNFVNWMRCFDSPRVWGNGAVFDNAVLKNSLIKCGKVIPWSHKNDRCYRTLIAQYEVKKVKPKIEHHALYDAVAQAETLLNAVSTFHLK